MLEDLITIATFDLTVQAELAKAKLESEGIDCLLLDKNLIGALGPFYSSMLGGIRLQVRESDAELARKILEHESPTSDTD